MSFNVIDSSGWLEYFEGDGNAGVFDEPINDLANLIVPTVVVYEVAKIMTRQRGILSANIAVAAMMRGTLADLDAPLALEAAHLSATHRLPMADSIILATARRFDATLWTQDIDFAGMGGVRYIAKP